MRGRIEDAHGSHIEMTQYAGHALSPDSRFECINGHEWGGDARDVCHGTGCNACRLLIRSIDKADQQALLDTFFGEGRIRLHRLIGHPTSGYNAPIFSAEDREWQESLLSLCRGHRIHPSRIAQAFLQLRRQFADRGALSPASRDSREACARDRPESASDD